MGTHKFEFVPAPERFGDLPIDRGVIFICKGCRHPTAAQRDSVLRAWGERGVIADVARRLRCPLCRRRGMAVSLSPTFAQLGSLGALDRLAADLRVLKPSGVVD